MPRALAPTIARPAAHAQDGPNRRLRRWLVAELRQVRAAIAPSAAQCQADR